MTASESAGCPFGDNYRPFDHAGMYEFFAEARRREPVFYNRELDCWVITRYDDAQVIFKDPVTYSASNSQTPIEPFPPEVTRLLHDGGFTRQPTQANLDPPDHTRIRRIAGRFLSPKRFRQIEPEVRAIAREYIGRMRDRDEIDLVEAITYELPARVIFLLLGVPDVDVRKVKEWSGNRFNMVWGHVEPDEALSAGRQLLDYWNYCSALVADRMESPGDDYASYLLEARDGDDESVTINEIKSLVFGILLAGHETTSNGLANLFLELLRTDQWRRVADNPELCANAVEEGLRFAPPFITWRRRTTTPVTIRGVDIPADATILIAMASTNRDEDAVSDSEQFIFDRDDPNHLSFGLGIHFCMGASLARLEMKVMLEELTAAFPRMELVENQQFEWERTISFRGPRQLLVRLNDR